MTALIETKIIHKNGFVGCVFNSGIIKREESEEEKGLVDKRYNRAG
jgi:hypothetical protein